MPIFFKGLGFVVLLWAAVSIWLAGWIERKLFPGIDQSAFHWSLICLASLIFAIPNFWVGRTLNDNDNGHTFMFIPVQYWSFIVPVLFILLKVF